MANSYVPPQTVFSGQYAPPMPPFWQHSNTHPPTPGNAPPFPPVQAVQHHPAFSAPHSNTNRFAQNNNAPSPVPFQLPQGISMEQLKLLANAPPPPLGMPPSTFAQNSPYTGAPVPPLPIPGQHLQHVRSPFPTTPTHAGTHSPAFRPQDAHHAQSQNGRPHESYQNHQTNGHPPIHSLDGVSMSRAFQHNPPQPVPNNRSPAQWNSHAVSQNAVPPTIEVEGSSSLTDDEKHAKAKGALAEIVGAGITYQDLVDESIKPAVLDQLFVELGFEKPVVALPGKEIEEEAEKQSPTATTQETIKPVVAAQSEPLDPSMSRKDRIAMLLAQKKGQSIASAKSSQSGSPAPVDLAVKPAVEAIPLVRRSMSAQPPQPPALNISTKEDIQIHTEPELPPQSAKTALKNFHALPTPVREEMKQQGFSIPGLFLTSDEQHGYSEASSPTAPPTELKSLKRNADHLSDEATPQAKRQVSIAVTQPEQVSLPDGVQASNVASVSSSSKMADVSLPGLGDSVKPSDNSMQASRSKVNQNKLKDRMAALKADLLRKNSRKQALQDGMPALDAEVEKTRERLTEQESRLSVVRQIIGTKSAELAEARDEESSLLQEIQRLELQLADGESGQQQFSTELTQLNDQISADEQASHPPQQAAVALFVRAPDVPLLDEIEVISTTEPSLDQEVTKDTKPTHLSPTDSNLRQPSHDRQQPETEYSPEQEDLDRQLNGQIATSAVQEQDPTNATDMRDEVECQPQQADDAHDAQVSTTTTPSDQQLIDISDDDDRMSIDEATDDGSDGSASMSDSGSDYEPATEGQTVQEDTIADNDDYDPEDLTPYEPPAPENDDYEPAEEVNVLNVNTLDDLPRTPEAIVSRPESALNSDIHIVSDDALASSALPTRQASLDLPSPYDEATTQQLTSDVVQPALIPSAPEDAEVSVPKFTPYESPLTNLKSFRFHPQFSERVKSGFRSLTYSNRIDPKTPLCPTELQGQMCMDVNCGEQHFGSMALSDDKILVQMSSANDFKDKDLRDAYLIGLKKVIADLRGQGVKEFTEVATALSRYRREWMAQQEGVI